MRRESRFILYYSVWAELKEICADHASTDFLSKIIIKFPALSLRLLRRDSGITASCANEVHYYGLYVTFRLFIISYDFSFHREFSQIEKKTSCAFCGIFLCCAIREVNESQYMNLLRLLKHRLQEDGKNERKKFEQQYEKREKLQKIAQPGEQSMLIFFCNSYVLRDHAWDSVRDSQCSFPFFTASYATYIQMQF